MPNHLYRGYAIYNKHREIKRALRGAKLEVEKLYLVFSDFDEEWFKLSDHLMKIPAFAENMNR